MTFLASVTFLGADGSRHVTEVQGGQSLPHPYVYVSPLSGFRLSMGTGRAEHSLLH